LRGTWRIPDITHGPAAAQLFTGLAADGRKLFADFVDLALISEWRLWAAAHPALVLTASPVP